MIRVFHVIDSLATGGAEQQLTLMLLRSDATRFQHAVCALRDADRHGPTLRAAGIPVYELHRSPRHETTRTLVELRDVMRDVTPDIVHTSLYWASVLGRTAARLLGKPVVTTLVNTIYEPEWRRDNPRLTPTKVAIARGLDGVTSRLWGTWFVAVTLAVRASAIRHLGIPQDRISIIPRGLPLDQIAPPPADQVAALRRDLGWDRHYPVVLSVGRLVPQKGHRYAIQAMARVAQAYPGALLAVAGEGPMCGELESLARSTGQADRIRLLGERRDVPGLLAATDLFIFPSLFEGFGGALVEAMAADKPCVTTQFAGVEELTDGGRVARVVPSASPDALGDALIDLARSPGAARALGAGAGEWARSRFDISTAVRSHELLYERLMARRDGQARLAVRPKISPRPRPAGPVTVLHVIDSLSTGGAEHQLSTLLAHADPTRFRHIVCSLRQTAGFAEDLRSSGIEVHSLDLGPRRDLVRGVWRLWRLVRKINPGVLHATLYRAALTSRTVGRLLHLPVITSLVSPTYEAQWLAENPHLKRWKVRVVHLADRLTAGAWGTWFVAISHAVKDSAVRQLSIPADRVSVIPRGLVVDAPNRFSTADVLAARALLGGPTVYPALLNIGRLVPQKGQRYAIAAMPKILDAYPQARLTIVGEGWLRPDLEALITKLELEEHVVLAGERRDVNPLLRAADVFVFPSISEGFGVALLQALGAGRPSVVSRIPALCEVTDSGRVALVVDERSPGAIAAAIIKLADDPAYAARLGGEGAAWVREQYDITASIRRLEALYGVVANGLLAPTEEASVAG